MFSPFFSLSVPSFGLFRGRKVIDIPSVEIHNIETESDKRARRFKHLVKLNHVNHAVLFNDKQFHNHTPHLLGSAYLLGGSPEHLNDCYEEESKSLVEWEDSPSEISKADWRDNLGKREYQRAYLDFFEDQLVDHGYDSQAVVDEFLLSGKNPLVNWLVADLGHPLIHLGYAYEVSSREICMEALTLASVTYNPMHKYIDDPTYSNLPTQYTTTSPQEVLARISSDSRFDSLSSTKGGSNFHNLFSDSTLEQAVLSHWNAWQISPNPKSAFHQSQKLAVAILICSRLKPSTSSESTKYDFYLLHLLTTSHALRILLPLLPGSHHLPLLRQWFFITVGYYIAQLRPLISYDEITNYDLQGRGWEYVNDMAVNGKHSTDAHFVKGCRAIKVASETWAADDKEEADYYLKAAVRFSEEFDGWGGFGVEGEMQ